MNELTNEAIERKLLGIVVNDPVKINDTRIFPDLFTKPIHKTVWENVNKLRMLGREISPANMGIESGDPDIELFVEKMKSRSLSPGDFESMLGLLTDLSNRRKTSKLCKAAYEQCYNMDELSSEIISDLESNVMKIRGQGALGVKQGGDMSAARAEFKWRCENPCTIKGMSVGFPITESYLDGFQGGQLYIIGARPGVGKTALITTWILNLIQSNRVPLVLSLEMYGLDIQKRLISSLSGVNMTVSKDRAFYEDELEKITKAMDWLDGKKWYYEDTSKIDIQDICSLARRLKSDEDIDILFIDYLQIIANKDFKANETRLRVAANCNILKQLAKELNIPVVVPAQLKRPDNVFDRVSKKTKLPLPQLHDLKESGDTEQDSDVIMFLHRDQAESCSYTHFIIAKNRNGEIGRLILDFTPQTTLFEEDKISTESMEK